MFWRQSCELCQSSHRPSPESIVEQCSGSTMALHPLPASCVPHRFMATELCFTLTPLQSQRLCFLQQFKAAAADVLGCVIHLSWFNVSIDFCILHVCHAKISCHFLHFAGSCLKVFVKHNLLVLLKKMWKQAFSLRNMNQCYVLTGISLVVCSRSMTSSPCLLQDFTWSGLRMVE